MNGKIGSILPNAIHEESGQVLWWAAAGMLGFLGMLGLSADVGRAFVAYDHLQSSTNAAALASAAYVYQSADEVNATANKYGAAGLNASPDLTSVVTNGAPICLNVLLVNDTGCASGAAYNAAKVTQTASVSTLFLRLFGVSSIPLKATAMASKQGVAEQWNVAIILDATGSMSTQDSDCGATRFQCAMNGIQTLLSSTNPCANGYTSCATSNANFHVSLFSFPGVSTSTVADDSTNCAATPNYMVYTLPLPTATSYTPLAYTVPSGSHSTTTWTATYQIVGFSSDYYANNVLNTSSSLVKAVTGCMSPISAPGSGTGGLVGASSGGITYYAAAIYAAQAALVAEQTANPGTKNAIIVVSDGQANIVSSTADFPSQANSTIASGSSGYTNLTGTGLYPDNNDECQQSIKAANDASAAGTRVYSVAYGSEASGCTGHGGTDNSLLSSGIYKAPLNVAMTSLSQITPCLTMENTASSAAYFYSDYNQSGSGSTCQDNSHPVTKLADIFKAIAADFTKPKLLPSNAQ